MTFEESFNSLVCLCLYLPIVTLNRGIPCKATFNYHAPRPFLCLTKTCTHIPHKSGGEILAMAEPLLERNFHPTIIVSGYSKALQKALETCEKICRTIDIDNMTELREIVLAAIGTKFSSRWGLQMVNLAINAVKKIVVKRDDGQCEVDIKRYVRIEKIPGGELQDCVVLDGVMFDKDVTHSKMRRRIENPRILLLDCPLEYKKGESQTNVEIMNESDFNSLLRQEEEYIEQICANVSLDPRPHTQSRLPFASLLVSRSLY